MKANLCVAKMLHFSKGDRPLGRRLEQVTGDLPKGHFGVRRLDLSVELIVTTKPNLVLLHVLGDFCLP